MFDQPRYQGFVCLAGRDPQSPGNEVDVWYVHRESFYLLSFFYPQQAALTQLIQYYHRFQKVLSQPPFKKLTVRSEMINIHHVMVEVKKHKTTF